MLRILAETDRLRLSILEVLKNEKSGLEEIRTALSLFVASVVIYPEHRVLIRYTLPGFAEVASTTKRKVTAPPLEVSRYSQLFEAVFIIT